VLYSKLDNTQNCLFLWGLSQPHLTQGSLGLPELAPKRHLDRLSRFCTVHPCDQHTDTHTTLRATPSDHPAMLEDQH